MLTQEAATDAKHQREVHIATHLLHITMTTHYQPTQNISERYTLLHIYYTLLLLHTTNRRTMRGFFCSLLLSKVLIYQREVSFAPYSLVKCVVVCSVDPFLHFTLLHAFCHYTLYYTHLYTLPHFTTRILPQVALQVEKAIAEQDLQN